MKLFLLRKCAIKICVCAFLSTTKKSIMQKTSNMSRQHVCASIIWEMTSITHYTHSLSPFCVHVVYSFIHVYGLSIKCLSIKEQKKLFRHFVPAKIVSINFNTLAKVLVFYVPSTKCCEKRRARLLLQR